MEQRSLELSLEYRYMFVTDITNCYGSINPQSIEWALSCKDTRHENNRNYTQDKKRKKSPYTMRLCKLVMGDSNEPLWNNDWLLPDLTQDLPVASVVNQETLSKVTPVITFRETRRYMELSDVPDLPDLDDAFIEVISRL